MRLKSLLLVAAIAVLTTSPRAALAQTPLPTPAAPARISPVKVVLVGDSTTGVIGGWGPSFCGKHLTHLAACINLARSGRSTKSYVTEGSWDVALAEMKSGGFAATYVTIQFAHNDQGQRPGVAVDLATEFPANLRRYVTEARAAGAVPILFTPLTKRDFKDGKLVDNLGPWAEAVRKVAAEMNVPLVDLYARSRAAVEAMGAVASSDLAEIPPSAEELAMAAAGTTSTVARQLPPLAPPPLLPGQEPMGVARLQFDTTHLGDKGADVFAALVTDELARAVPALRRFLIP